MILPHTLDMIVIQQILILIGCGVRTEIQVSKKKKKKPH